MIYDAAIIGAGVSGNCIAMELAKYNLKVCIIEKCDDVACGTSKANSGIIHAGYDPKPETLMAKLNIQGSLMYEKLSEDLNFPYKKTGSLVLAFNDADCEHIKKLYERGIQNGIPKENLSIINHDELVKIEPNVNEDAVAALYAKGAAIVSPYAATWAFAENAIMNGAELFLNHEVHAIKKSDDASPLFEIVTGEKIIQAKTVINAAGVYSDKISEMAGARKFSILCRMGEYFLLDNKCENLAKHTLFTTPDEKGKGVLVTPTVDGNILSGPTAVDVSEKDDLETSSAGQNLIFEKAEKSVPGIPKRNIINSFAGMRAIAINEDGKPVNDFIIEEDSKVSGFVNVAGICSPGLTAAPAIGIYVCEIVKKILSEKYGMKIQKKENVITTRKGIESFKEASKERKIELIKLNPLYGRIICRCEMITEAEIVQAINSVVGAVDLDGVKRRTRSGMGRCQGGFCSPRVTEIISREKNIKMECVTKCGGCSYILNSTTR